MKAAGPFYIRADGSVDPSTPLIQRTGDYYTLTGNVTSDSDGIIIERDNMTLDGQGYWLQGYSTGITITGRGNITVRNVQFKSFSVSVYISNCQNATLSRNNITENGSYGIFISESSGCTISENRIIEYTEAGIALSSSSGNSIAWNEVTRVVHGGTHTGIAIASSDGNSLIGNTVANNWRGIALMWSTGNTLRSNSIVSDIETVNPHGLVVEGEEGNVLHFIQDIDSSNTIQSKPIYYWVNQTGKAVPTDASTVALISCDHITVQNLDLSKSYYGVLLYSTTDCLVSNNNIANNYYGVRLYGSSRNVISQNEISGNDGYGVDIAAGSQDNVISENNITLNNYVGIEHQGSANTIIQNNNITKTVYSEGSGIVVASSANVTLTGNIVAQLRKGIVLSSGGNTLSGNTITSCSDGLWLSSGNLLSANTLTDNECSISLSGGSSVSDYLNNVDSSNTVNGKPVCYWVDQHDKTVPSNAGFIFLVSCSGITVEYANMIHERQGIGLVAVTNTTVRFNMLDSNYVGIMLRWCSEVTISQNTISESLNRGIEMLSSNGNTISGNNMTANGYASSYGINIYLHPSSNNLISGNYMRYCQTAAVYLHYSAGNVVSGNDIQGTTYSGVWKYGAVVLDEHTGGLIVGNEIRFNNADAVCLANAQNNNITENNIISNLRGIRFEGYTTNNRIYRNNIVESSLWLVSTLPNAWDNGYPDGGNYWDFYVDVDNLSGPGQNITGSDGFWDNQLNVTENGNNIDHYPRVVPTRVIARSFESYGRYVGVDSNSSVTEFQFNETAKTINFNVTGQTGTSGFCDVLVPKDLLWGVMTVYKDGVMLSNGTDYTQTQNATHHIFHIEYSHSSHRIEIRGTEAIPEFPSALILPLFLTATLLAIATFKVRRPDFSRTVDHVSVV
ncbi:MAG: NosD domain-containing protein [Candidatus Bathyarchaeia archaeon]